MEKDHDLLLYFGSAPTSREHGRSYWKTHERDYRNPAIDVKRLQNNRISVDLEVRNHCPNEARGATISLYVNEGSLANMTNSQARILLRNLVANCSPVATWENQVIDPSTVEVDAPWKIPDGPIQAYVEPNFGGHFLVVATVQMGEHSFMSLLGPDGDLATLPAAGVHSTTVPEHCQSTMRHSHE